MSCKIVTIPQATSLHFSVSLVEEMSEEAASASLAVWIELLLTAGVSFWCQAAVTEERYVNFHLRNRHLQATAYNVSVSQCQFPSQTSRGIECHCRTLSNFR